MSMLINLLTRNRDYSPVYPTSAGLLSNHLSMALVALKKMGATDAQITAFSNNYATRLVPCPEIYDLVNINDKNWEHYLGNNVYFPNYIKFFKNKIEEMGIEKTISKYINKLMEGVLEIHGLIRLAYAIESHDPQEVAITLAYFAAFFAAYKKINNPDYDGDPDKGISAFRNEKNLTMRKFPGKNIHERLEKVLNLPEFTTTLKHFKLDEKTFPNLANLLVSLHAMTNDFVVLHALTMTHALRIIWPYITNKQDCINHYWQIICAIYVYVGAPQINNLSDNKNSLFQTLPLWKNVLLRAVADTDAHVIKLVYSCHEEYQVYRNPAYLYVASRAVHLLD